MSKSIAMYRYNTVRLLLGACAAALLVGCQSVPGALDSADRGATIVLPALKEQTTPEMAATSRTTLVLGSQDGVLSAHDVMSGLSFKLGPVQDQAQVSVPRLTTRDGNVLALWLETITNEKSERDLSTWVRASRNGGREFSDAVKLGREHAYVSHAEVTVTAGGEIWIVTLEWDKETQRPELRLNRWNEAGISSTLLAQGEDKARWTDPRIVTRDERAWIVWAEAKTRGGAVQMLESGDAGQTWSRRDTVVEAQQLVGLQLLRSKDRLLVTWMGASNAVQGRARADGVGAWVEVAGLPTRDDGLIGGYKATAAPDGAVHVLYTLRREQGDQHALYYRRSDDGLSFGAAQRLNTSTPEHVSTADVPVLSFDASGKQVLAAWLDLRHFRSAIYANYSSDGGRSWLAQDFAVNPQPGARMALFPSAASLGGSRFALAWTESPDTLRKETATVVTVLDASATTAVAPMPDPERLKGRVSAYWQARVDSNTAATLPLYDPFYRERTTAEGHIAARERFKVLIHGFEVGETSEITPARYTVKVRFEHEVKPFDLPDGRKAEVPRGWVETDQEWIWIDGDWHVVDLDLMRKPVLTY